MIYSALRGCPGPSAGGRPERGGRFNKKAPAGHDGLSGLFVLCFFLRIAGIKEKFNVSYMRARGSDLLIAGILISPTTAKSKIVGETYLLIAGILMSYTMVQKMDLPTLDLLIAGIVKNETFTPADSRYFRMVYNTNSLSC